VEFVKQPPPPIRRLPLEDAEPATQVLPPVQGNGHAGAASAPVASGFTAARRSISAPQFSIRRMEVDDVSISYGEKQAVKNVSLPIRQGEVLSLIGPSGCGKTTLLRSLNRLTELTATARLDGSIRLDDVDITLIEPTLLRRRVTMVFQQPNPFPMSVFDNIAYVLREQGSRRTRKKELEPAVHSALQRAGLFEEVKDNLKHPALKLSGGQQQRLCIARALAAEPEVLLLDEPCSALDPQSTQVIEDLIVKLRDDVAVVIVTHNLQQAYRVADHVAFMYLGDLVEYNSATALFGSPREQRTAEYVSGAFG
jgi:phosphate transport system ATP-binding protein